VVLPRTPVLGLRALRASYFAAVADAGLAVAMDLAGPLVGDAELVVPRMLAALPGADQEALLAPLQPILNLPSAQRSAYVRTLDALYRHGGTQTGAAAVLHVHANTVRYRMDRIEEMTGMRLDDPRDRMRLDLAAMLVVLRGWPPDVEYDFGLSVREEPLCGVGALARACGARAA
jgi:DNA-binding PucR family transcriptional regulator